MSSDFVSVQNGFQVPTSVVLNSSGQVPVVVPTGGLLFPGTLAANYVIATAAAAKFTAGTYSHNATVSKKIMSVAGGAVSINYADGGTDTFTLPALVWYEVAASQINKSGTVVTDLVITL
jgi:hypothetical protein